MKPLTEKNLKTYIKQLEKRQKRFYNAIGKLYGVKFIENKSLQPNEWYVICGTEFFKNMKKEIKKNEQKKKVEKKKRIPALVKIVSILFCLFWIWVVIINLMW